MDDATVAVEVPVEAIIENAEPPAPPEIPVDPNALIAADVELQRQEQETERARIEAAAEVKIAKIEAEEPAWLNDIRECLTLLTAQMAELMASRQSSTQPTNAVTVVTEPEAPVVTEPELNVEGEGALTPAEPEAPEAEPAPARRRRHWI